MKKLLAGLLAGFMIFSITACSNKNGGNETQVDSSAEYQNHDETGILHWNYVEPWKMNAKSTTGKSTNVKLSTDVGSGFSGRYLEIYVYADKVYGSTREHKFKTTTYIYAENFKTEDVDDYLGLKGVKSTYYDGHRKDEGFEEYITEYILLPKDCPEDGSMTKIVRILLRANKEEDFENLFSEQMKNIHIDLNAHQFDNEKTE